MQKKKICRWLAAVGIPLLLASGVTGAQKIKVVTTTTDLKALAEAVGKDKVEVTAIARGYEDPHFVEAKPSHMLKLQKTDLLVKVGLDLEIGWLPVLLDGARNPKIMPGAPGHVDASKSIAVLEVPTGKVERSQGDIHALGNPHYWLDPENAKASAASIADGLKAIDPSDAAFFEANLKTFNETLTQQEARWVRLMEPFQGAKVITYHNSWPYFVRRFGLNVVGYVEPKPGIPPPPSHVAELIDQVKREGIKLIIMEPYFSEKIPQLVASQTGCRVLVLPPSVGGVKGVDDYAALLDYDLNQIVSALKGQGTP